MVSWLKVTRNIIPIGNNNNINIRMAHDFEYTHEHTGIQTNIHELYVYHTGPNVNNQATSVVSSCFNYIHNTVTHESNLLHTSTRCPADTSVI